MHSPPAARPVTRRQPRFRRAQNWLQLGRFAVVGASGYAVNLAVYALVLEQAGLHYMIAATTSFLLAASWNYWWNRTWTFHARRGHVASQGGRFLIVSAAVYGANLAALVGLVALGLDKLPAQAVAIVLVTPFNFLANKFWSFKG